MNPLRFPTATLLALLSAAPGFAAKDDTTPRGPGAPFDFAKPPSEQAATFVEVTRGANLKKISKLAIVNFTVEFFTAKHIYVATRTKAADWEKASQQIDLPALDLPAIQEITNRLYDQLVADLKASGVEIIPFEQLKVSKHYANLKGAQHETPWRLDNPHDASVFIGAHGMPIYVDNPERFKGIKALGVSFGTNTRLHEVMLCNEFKANLLSVNMVVDFGDLKTGKFFTEVKTTFGHYLQGKTTRLRFAAVGQPDFAFIALKQRVESGSVPLSHGKSTVKDTTTLLESASIDGKRTREVTTEVFFDQALYTRDTDRLLRAANAVFMTSFAKERGGAVPESTQKPIN